MFLKRLERRKGRKKHTYWAFVESYRTGKGSCHRVVAYLGELSKREKSGWEQLDRRLNGQGRLPRTLFDPPDYVEPTDEEPVLVKLKSIQLQRLRVFGDVWLALGVWRLLGLDTLLENLIPAGREVVRLTGKQDSCRQVIGACPHNASSEPVAGLWRRRGSLLRQRVGKLQR